MKRVLIQGAMQSELQIYLEQPCFRDAEEIVIHGYSFVMAKLDDMEVIIQLTKMGMTNAAVATMIALYEYKPDIVINQGTAGAQINTLKSGDIVIGKEAVNVHSLEMPSRDYGEGMAPKQWVKMQTEYLPADSELVQLFEKSLGSKTETGNVVTGILGSGDLFSKEKDRILWLHDCFGHVSEDMESFAVYQACMQMGVPCIALRVISNNELLNENYNPDTAIELQRVIWETVHQWK